MNLKHWMALTVLVISFYSCSSPRYIYAGSPPNNPYFKEKGETKLSGSYSAGAADNGSQERSNNEGFDIQGAYAITDHWAATAAFFSRNEWDIYLDEYNFFKTSTVNYKRRLIELGGGYFTTLNPAKSIGFTFLGGMGFGKFNFRDNGLTDSMITYTRFHNSRIRKIYFQPGFSLMPGNNFRMMFVHRFSFVHFGGISTSYTAEERDYFRLDRIHNRSRYFGETTLGFHFAIPGARWLALETSATVTSQPDIDYNRIRARGIFATIGLSFDVSKMKE